LGTRGQHANHYTTEAANMQNYWILKLVVRKQTARF
jgi:hypothetical protein